MDENLLKILNDAFDKILLKDSSLENIKSLKSSLSGDKNIYVNLIKDISLKGFLKDKSYYFGEMDTMNSNWIHIENTSSPANEEVIPFNITVEGSFFVDIPLSAGGNIRLFINNDDRVAPGKVFYDYFGSGELYVNIPEGSILINASVLLKRMMNRYFFDEEALIKHFIPEGVGINYQPHITSCKSPFNSMYGWEFELNTFFNVVTQTVATSPVLNPICKYYSLVDDDTNIVSPYYNFANHIIGHQNCSCPGKTGKANVVQLCDVPTSLQTRCQFYEPLSDSVVKVSISPKNTTNSTEFEMTHFSSIDGQNVFKIMNLTDNVIINQIQIPADISFEDATKEAHSIFDEYVSCYTDHTFEQQSSEKIVEKKSFIETLIEA